MIRAGDIVTIRPEWQDEGDDQYIWQAMDDAEKGRVTISPINHPNAIKPRYLVYTHQLGETK